jgi:hypothetical protein
LPAAFEEEFELRWEEWLDNTTDWAPFFKKMEALQGTDLISVLRGFELVSERDVEAYGKLRRTAEGKAVPLSGVFGGSNGDIALLALGFARGEPGALAVPYARIADA